MVAPRVSEGAVEFVGGRLPCSLRKEAAGAGRPLDVRELIVHTGCMKSSHRRTARPQATEVAMRYRIDEALAVPEPGVAAVVETC